MRTIFGVPHRSKVVRRAAVTVLAAALVAGAATPAAATAQDRPELHKAIQEWIDDGFAGIQMRVHDERGDWVGSAGVRKLGESAKPPTNGRYWIGSTTKTFMATVVLQLVAEGRVGLDASVAGYLPDLGLDPRITVRMMLQHTSGLFNYTGDAYDDGVWVPGLPSVGKEWVDNRFKSYQPEELVRFALSKPAKFAPGTSWSYANTNYTLALLLIEKVTGRPYAEEMQRRILGPLRLTGTSVPGNRPDLPGPHAHGYYRYEDAGQWKVVDVTRQNLSLLAGAGNMISTTKDVQTFMSALVSGRLLPAALLTEMSTPDPRSAGLFGSYGLGLYVLDTGPDCAGIVLNHDGSPPGGYGSLMYSTPDGSKVLTASLTSGDAAVDTATVFPKALNRLINEVFCDGRQAQ
ncbi:serine hydrolase domain-containing protein [Nonomuraea sp. NPDC003709]|uniref:serine hydrolase domain-containing protein n=1 Tax=Nonomuraea sp. NPDC003709 TaxID=3154450 RepID=UPI0033A47332